MLASVLLMLTIVSLTWLAIVGKRVDRMAVAAFTIVLIASPLVEGLVINNLRWGVALLSLSLFLTLFFLALRSDRWWLLVVAGCQLLALSTYLVALMRPDTLIWTAVTIRRIAWGQQMIVCFFAVWEVTPGRSLLRTVIR